MTLPPPTSPLFPYTTLFRSSFLRLQNITVEYALDLPLLTRSARSARLYVSADNLFVITDRKSTRLNSSHRCISYAVFCLKKKNKKAYQQKDTRDITKTTADT